MLSDKPAENRFLIVDNYPFGRDTLRRSLLSLGASKVDIAVSASSAINMCKNVDYDMVLADYDLGEGKNGQQLLEELRSQKILPNVSAFVILTSETQRDVVLSTLEYQPDDYLAKPYPQNLLIRRVKRLLRYKSSLHEVFQSIDGDSYQLAVQDCENYLASNDEFRSNTQRILAELHHTLGNSDSAREIYDLELINHDSDWARLGLAKVHLQQGRLYEAEALYLELIDINYMYIEAYEDLSKIYLETEDFKKAEDIMARAVLVSPLSIRRQQWYASICERNNHYDTAIGAWRNIIKATRNTKYESADNHLNLSRCISDFCDHHDTYTDNVVTSEIARHLDLMRTRFHVYGDNELQSLLIEGRVSYGKGNKEDSKERMAQAKALYEESPSSFSEDCQLEFAKTLSQSGDNVRAERVLKALVKNSKDPAILSKADKILDEPVSKDGKSKIIKLNRQGIKQFKAAEYPKAAEYFREAQMFFPKNIELNLNLTQALLKSIKVSTDSNQIEQWLTEAEQCLTQIRGIPTSHKKYNNYQRLSKELLAMQDDIAA
ncbi:response regulator [Oceanicoccus sagamiensis]|uniref:Response regulatory domain-containing protein n=1 Tax=Oceanicoccus sagamiensis TaxID=716816 RepID=A0A1X9N750_9GAMM|nr:response regulator [Oceanicoccus sagamiensis]ARN73920.1 hypothetical protein BST96_07200 [Oceanicoccus sagamiensis]